MPKEYVTIQGDMWDGISYKVYRNEYYMTDLIDANPDHREIVVFPAGVRLTVPDVSVPVPELLPPWKRGGS